MSYTIHRLQNGKYSDSLCDYSYYNVSHFTVPLTLNQRPTACYITYITYLILPAMVAHFHNPHHQQGSFGRRLIDLVLGCSHGT